jgi:hypothetical protein
MHIAIIPPRAEMMARKAQDPGTGELPKLKT